MSHAWVVFCEIFTVVGLITLLLTLLPMPIFDRNGTTLICATKGKQVETAKMLAAIIGNPIAVLDTAYVHRFLFKDGTSVDWLAHPPEALLDYDLVALKSVVLGLFSVRSPHNFSNTLLYCGDLSLGIFTNPDATFHDGDVVICTSRKNFSNANGSGFGFIIRKHAFNIRGPRPARFRRF